MIIVIIAGGSGTRLWPLSTNEYPKHLLKLTDELTLLESTVARAREIAPTENIFVISEQSHVHHVKEQLKDVPQSNIYSEPGRRGTASCIAWALSEIANKNLDESEPIAFLWADHLIRDVSGFAADLLLAGEAAKKERKIVFVGLPPTYPSTGLGYIHKGQPVKGWSRIYQMSGFVEKPDSVNAQKYFDSGEYLWNMGYLVGTLQDFVREMKESAPDMLSRYQKLLHASDISTEYMKLESVAVEYVFSELLKDAYTIAGSFDWVDIGSFNDLHGAVHRDENNNYLHGSDIHAIDIENIYIRNDEDKPIAVIGLDNVVVVNTKNGLLVARKDLSQRVGEVAKKIQSN